jgi:tripartite-type tricarboxylate transporter receptor subunit TctC
LNYGSAGIGGANHLAPELFKSMAHVDVVHIAYKGVGPALNDLISGRLQVMFPAIVSGMPHVKSGRLRALAVTTAEPTALGPGLPTVAAAGLPGYEASYLLMVLAPAKTPAAIIKQLSEGIAGSLNEPETKDKLFAIGIEAVGSTPQVLAQTAKIEVAKWGKLIKEARIHY